ncbi:glycerophosphodiester phosphodiesterase family protein [Glutamicibacter endophyticus]|uniref:glycerophosphodiester phosphodiesterase family protein n=1 Tax=Glutamicibacter endophyticus TaxID=1522174 RepID=UPI003AF12706
MTYAFSHRGVRTGSEENTLLAFERAWQAGIRHFETDVRASKDGTVYAFHDDTLDRVTDARGPIAEYTDAQLAEVRANGQPLCRLEELLDAFPEAMLNIDVKDEAVIAPLACLIDRRSVHERIALASFDDRRSAAVAHLLGRPVRRSPGQRQMAQIYACAQLLGRVPRGLLRPYWAVQIPATYKGLPVATRRLVRAVQGAGTEVHVWVVNDEAQMRQLVERGVDALMTDRAPTLMRVLRG